MGARVLQDADDLPLREGEAVVVVEHGAFSCGTFAGLC